MIFAEFIKRFDRCECEKAEDWNEYKRTVEKYKVFTVFDQPAKPSNCIVAKCGKCGLIRRFEFFESFSEFRSILDTLMDSTDKKLSSLENIFDAYKDRCVGIGCSEFKKEYIKCPDRRFHIDDVYVTNLTDKEGHNIRDGYSIVQTNFKDGNSWQLY